jgi:GNAT superfamily N-acetyltransferase
MGDALCKFEVAAAADAQELALLHTSVAEDLTQRYRPGPWSSKSSEKGILFALRTTRVFVARQGAEILATFRLTQKKPWAIDTSYFSLSRSPVYLLAMAVKPARQGQGIGRACLEEAGRLASLWPADSIRLDAFDADAGAGGFYARCGYSKVGHVSYRSTPLIYFELLLPGKSHGGAQPRTDATAGLK